MELTLQLSIEEMIMAKKAIDKQLKNSGSVAAVGALPTWLQFVTGNTTEKVIASLLFSIAARFELSDYKAAKKSYKRKLKYHEAAILAYALRKLLNTPLTGFRYITTIELLNKIDKQL